MLTLFCLTFIPAIMLASAIRQAVREYRQQREDDKVWAAGVERFYASKR